MECLNNARGYIKKESKKQKQGDNTDLAPKSINIGMALHARKCFNKRSKVKPA